MEQTAKIVEVEGDKAKIMVVRKSACGHDCSQCGGACGKETPLFAYVENPLAPRLETLWRFIPRTANCCAMPL